jgi:hypothetical protein
MLTMLFTLLLSIATADPLSYDTGQWGDVVELLQHIAATESAAEEPPAYVVDYVGPSVCYDNLGQMTQLYVMHTEEWQMLGVPVMGTVVEALHHQEDPNIKYLDPARVLPCAVMGGVTRPEPEESILADLLE